MNLQITNAGASLIQSATGPITMDSYVLGSDYNYIPAPTDTGIRGTQVASGTPSAPAAINANIIKYSIYLDYNAGPFEFGELAISSGGTVVAIGASTELIEKIAAGLTVGNSIRIDIYLSMVGTNYDMWFDLAESNNSFRVAILDSPDRLPVSSDATPNMYILQGAANDQSPLLAYTDRNGLWNFDVYQYSNAVEASVIGFSSTSITIALGSYVDAMTPEYFGQVIIEFVTGRLYSICRYVRTAIVSGSTATISFDTPLAITPLIGDKFLTFTRVNVSTVPKIPVATEAILGGIKIGNGLEVTEDGTTSVDIGAFNLVTSVNEQTGDITINASNLPGLATVGRTGLYSDLIGAPGAYTLPTMALNIKGGAQLPANGNLVVANEVLDLGFAPVKRVNNVVPDANGNVTISTSYTLPVATDTVLGGVKQGANVNIAADGTISVAAPYTLPIAGAALGGVKVGSNLGIAVAADGTISASVRTVNGAGPDVGGNITVPPDSNKLDRVLGQAQAIRYTDVYQGLRTAATGMPINLSLANSFGALFDTSSTGTITWTFTNWTPGVYAEVQIELTNAGLATTHAFPAAVQFILPDGTVTSSYAAVLNAQRGTTNFQTNGKDFLCFWSRDGGTTVYCKIM